MLGSLRHPSIAQLFDAGQNDTAIVIRHGTSRPADHRVLRSAKAVVARPDRAVHQGL